MQDALEIIADFRQGFPTLAQELGPRNTELLIKATTSLALPAGRKIIRDRMPVDSLFLVLGGEVSITVEEGGQAIQLGTVGAGQWLGEVSVLSGELLASSTVTSTTAVRMLRLRHEKFEQLISTHFDIATILLRQLVGMLADRLRHSVSSFGDITSADQGGHAPEPTFDPSRAEGRNWIRSFFRNSSGT